MLAVFTFAKLDCFVRQIFFYYFFTTQILGPVAADLLSRAARYLPKPALNYILSLCVYYDLYGCDTKP